MSFTYFEEPIVCPECGFHTHELWHDLDTDEKGKVLKCESCFADSTGELDALWTGTDNEAEDNLKF